MSNQELRCILMMNTCRDVYELQQQKLNVILKAKSALNISLKADLVKGNH
jgi:hypothetical protein